MERFVNRPPKSWVGRMLCRQIAAALEWQPMSYLVLARKYRPRHFGEMVGQEHVVQALSNALEQQRLHHAYLFTGTRGVGKTTISRILAKSLNCTGVDGTGGITATPCGQCPACTAIDAGRFVDYTELDAASNRSVDEVQALLEQAVYKPVQGRFKVFMIDEVHMLTNTAFNAMLKTLEEPPEYLKFVLATTDPQKVPVTVLSRCLQFNLRPMAPDTVCAHLQQVLQAEQIAAEPGALRLLARAARGSMRDALSLTDQAIAFSAGQGVREESVRQMLGSVDSSYVLRLIDALADGHAAQVIETVRELQYQGLSAASTLEDMAQVLQRMAVLQWLPAGAPQAADAVDPDAAEIARRAARMPADETQLLYSICIHGRAELGLAPDEYAGLNMVLLRLLAFKPQPGAEKKTLKSAEPATSTGRSAGAASATSGRTVPLSSPPAAPEPARMLPTGEGQTSNGQQPATVAETFAQVNVCHSAAEQPAPQTAEPKAAKSAAATIAVVTNGEPKPQGEPEKNQSPMPEENAGGDGDIPPWEPLPLQAEVAEIAPAAAPAYSGEGQANAVFAPESASQPVATGHLSDTETARAEAVEAPPAPSLAATELGDAWYRLAQTLCEQGAVNGLARELLLQTQLVRQNLPDGSGAAAVWALQVEKESVNHEPSRKRLEQAVSTQMGYPVRLQVGLGRVTDSPQQRQAAKRAQERQQAEQAFASHPFVQTMMRDFGAQTLAGSVAFVSDPAAAPGR